MKSTIGEYAKANFCQGRSRLLGQEPHIAAYDVDPNPVGSGSDPLWML
jgi:hypothetical protein